MTLTVAREDVGVALQARGSAGVTSSWEVGMVWPLLEVKVPEAHGSR